MTGVTGDVAQVVHWVVYRLESGGEISLDKIIPLHPSKRGCVNVDGASVHT